MEDKPILTVHVEKLSEDREQSFWYHNQHIATCEFNGKTLLLEARGEIRLQFEENGTVYKNEQAVDKAMVDGLTDESLDKILEFDGWHNNNWFAIVEIDHLGNIGDDIDLSDTYSDGLSTLYEIIQGDY
jgi:hypothetical protein